MASKEESNILTGESEKFKYRREVMVPQNFGMVSVYTT